MNLWLWRENYLMKESTKRREMIAIRDYVCRWCFKPILTDKLYFYVSPKSKFHLECYKEYQRA